MPHYDVIISGASLVGLSLARALASLPIKIALIEPRALTQNTASFSESRAIALSYGSRIFFSELGLWPQLLALSNPIASIHCSEKGHCGHTRLDAHKEGLDALGYVIPFADLQTQLYQSVREQKNLTFFSPATVHALSDSAENSDSIEVKITLANDEIDTLNTRLLVASDGVRSFIRQQQGIAVEETPYKQAAIIADIQPTLPHKNRAYERFTQQGPMALLPLKNGLCALVLSVPIENMEAMLNCRESDFLDHVQQRFGYRLGHLRWASPRQGFPLSMTSAKELTRARTLLIGNAAHALHPIAGQGFNLGLRDVAALKKCLIQTHEKGEDIGSEALLKHYTGLRQHDHRQTCRFTHGLIRAFEPESLPVTLARNMAMHAINVCSPLKHGLTRRAAGLSQRASLEKGLAL